MDARNLQERRPHSGIHYWRNQVSMTGDINSLHTSLNFAHHQHQRQLQHEIKLRSSIRPSSAQLPAPARKQHQLSSSTAQHHPKISAAQLSSAPAAAPKSAAQLSASSSSKISAAQHQLSSAAAPARTAQKLAPASPAQLHSAQLQIKSSINAAPAPA
jgi:hypothetical protein